MSFRSNEQVKFLARKALAQSKRMIANNAHKKPKTRRDIENQNSVRVLMPQCNNQNFPVTSIKVPPSDKPGSQHFSGALHLYLRSSLAKYCQKRHVAQPQHSKALYSQRKHNYDIPVSQQQYPIIRSRSTIKHKVQKDLKSQLSLSQFGRQFQQRHPSRRKQLQMIDLNINGADQSFRKVSQRKIKELGGNGFQSQTRKMIRRREDFVRSSFKLG